MTDEYSIEAILPDGTVDSLDSGTNVAILGPPMVGKRELVIDLLGAGYVEGDGILCVTTKRSDSVYESLSEQIPNLDRSRVGIIDCSGADADLIEEMTERVGSPGDLTGISVSTAKLFQEFRDRGIGEIRYGLISISTLLQYLSNEQVFQFLHIYSNRVNETGGFGIYTMDEAHSDEVINTITGLFDVLIEVQEAEDGREVRIRGSRYRSDGWLALE